MAGRNFDYPKPFRGRMAKNALREMAQQADRLNKSLLDEDALPAWVDYYIATSSDRMSTVGNYMQGELRRYKSSTPEQQTLGDLGLKEEDLGNADALYAQVMLNGNYADISEVYPEDMGNLFDDALDKVAGWASSGQEEFESTRSLLRTAAYIYMACIPVAAGVAWYRSESVPKTIGAAALSIPYLLYVSGKALFSK